MTNTKARKPKPAAAGSREESSSTGTVHRTIRLIAAISSARGDVGVGELSAELSLPIPTIHRLLHLLRDVGIVEWEPRSHRYMIGPELYRIAAKVSASTDMRDLALAELTKLAEVTDETLLFALYQPGSCAASFEARAEGNNPLQYRVQMHAPFSLVWGAAGKAILAYLPEDMVSRALQLETKCRAEDGQAPPSLEQLMEELMRLRKAGYSVSEGERLAGARGVAAPVFGLNGIKGSICVTAPKDRIPISRISEFGELVMSAAKRLSHSLGGPAA